LDGSSRPTTHSALAVKTWRKNLFPTTSPASRREVELLGEWLNSVLAENLEKNESPLDVCANAQHWFSVAFNELVRQVAVDCAERGRLYAVIWKRNQDLLTKLVQVQREEREYILACHKDRIQFLRTDLEFSQGRLTTIQTAFDEEQQRWDSSHERDVTKFDSLQQKIDEQIASRQQLATELRDLQRQLGLTEDKPTEPAVEEPAPSFLCDDLVARSQSLRWLIRDGKVELPDVSLEIEDIAQYLDREQHASPELRIRFGRYFLLVPQDRQPQVRSAQWLLALISYVYSYYMALLSGSATDPSLTTKPFSDMVYEMLLGVYGLRLHAEIVFLDLLYTIRSFLEITMPRIHQFARFLQIVDPLPIKTLHFYLHEVAVMNRSHTGPLFPEVESGDSLISGIPTPVACGAAQKILARFVKGRTLKFYSERLDKIASDGMMKFGGKNVAELDQVLDYILSAYVEECAKLEDAVKEQFAELPDKEIKTFSQFQAMVSHLPRNHRVMSRSA
jgi:hypothetical protein